MSEKRNLQAIMDDARAAQKAREQEKAIDFLLEAVVLLARGQQQLMRDFQDAQSSRTDIQIK